MRSRSIWRTRPAERPLDAAGFGPRGRRTIVDYGGNDVELMERARTAPQHEGAQVFILRPDRQDMPVFVIDDEAMVSVFTTVRQAQLCLKPYHLGDHTLVFDKRLRRYGFVAGRLSPVRQLSHADVMPHVRAAWGLYAESPDELPGWMEWHLIRDVVQ